MAQWAVKDQGANRRHAVLLANTNGIGSVANIANCVKLLLPLTLASAIEKNQKNHKNNAAQEKIKKIAS